MTDISKQASQCRGCFALGSQSTCNYIFIMDRRRPCPPGAACMVKMTRKEFNMRKANWDTVLGRQMWEEGKKDAEIADAFGIPTGTVTSYRLKHWDQTNVPKKKPFSLEGMQPVAVDDDDDTPAEPEADSPAAQENEISRVPVPETHAPAKGQEHDEPLPPQKIEIMDVLAAATEHLSGIRAVCTASAIQSLWFWRYPEDLLRARDSIDYLLKRLEAE